MEKYHVFYLHRDVPFGGDQSDWLAIEPGNRIRVIDRGAAARVYRVAAVAAVALQLHCECDRSIDYLRRGWFARSLKESRERELRAI